MPSERPKSDGRGRLVFPRTYGQIVSFVLSVISHASFEKDNNGQIIIYTGLEHGVFHNHEDSKEGFLVEHL